MFLEDLDATMSAARSWHGRCLLLCAETFLVRGERRAASELQGRMGMGTVIIVLLVLLLVGALPTWPYSGGWGYYPSGGLGLVLLIVLILALTGRL
jgi:hypothetical protein